VTDQWLKFGLEYPHMMSLGIVSVTKAMQLKAYFSLVWELDFYQYCLYFSSTLGEICYTGWSKSLCTPDNYSTIIRCTETFWSLCI